MGVGKLRIKTKEVLSDFGNIKDKFLVIFDLKLFLNKFKGVNNDKSV
jgi:hypothetical protein